jgi:hypothetical protein
LMDNKKNKANQTKKQKMNKKTKVRYTYSLYLRQNLL